MRSGFFEHCITHVERGLCFVTREAPTRRAGSRRKGLWGRDNQDVFSVIGLVRYPSIRETRCPFSANPDAEGERSELIPNLSFARRWAERASEEGAGTPEVLSGWEKALRTLFTSKGVKRAGKGKQAAAEQSSGASKLKIEKTENGKIGHKPQIHPPGGGGGRRGNAVKLETKFSIKSEINGPSRRCEWATGRTSSSCDRKRKNVTNHVQTHLYNVAVRCVFFQVT